MPTPICDTPDTWTWPADVRARLDAQRIAMPEPKKPEPPKPAEDKPDLNTMDEVLHYMYGEVYC